jgi:hypothetical protein
MELCLRTVGQFAGKENRHVSLVAGSQLLRLITGRKSDNNSLSQHTKLLFQVGFLGTKIIPVDTAITREHCLTVSEIAINKRVQDEYFGKTN